jgi:hypothetical protein
MGNNASKGDAQSNDETKLKTLSQVVDYLAANFILSQNFQDMAKLSDSDYCDKLVVLTSKVIAQKLNNMEIAYLAQRLKQGEVINEMTKGDVIFFEKDQLKSLDVQNPTKKRRLCIGIAKYYVKIAHLFAAIVTTINPVYTYTNADGVKTRVSLMNKGEIPEGVNVKVKKVGLCSARINALLNSQSIEPDDQGNITIKPNFCGMNQNKKSRAMADAVGEDTKNLMDEPGIPELKELYKDVYDFDQGGYKSMSESMKVKYLDDVKRFYKEFTGEEEVPENIKNFKDIKLRAYHKSSGCAPGKMFDKAYTGSSKNKAFAEYAKVLKTMIKNTDESQQKLLDILDDIFVFSFNQVDKKKQIIISPKLNEAKLQQLVDSAREIIVNLYITCEKEFVDALEAFEAIVHNQVLETSLARLGSLDESLDLHAAPEGVKKSEQAQEAEPAAEPVAERAAEAEVSKEPIIMNDAENLMAKEEAKVDGQMPNVAAATENVAEEMKESELKAEKVEDAVKQDIEASVEKPIQESKSDMSDAAAGVTAEAKQEGQKMMNAIQSAREQTKKRIQEELRGGMARRQKKL